MTTTDDRWTREGRAMAGHADLDGTRIAAATPEVERCWFCLNDATHDGEVWNDAAGEVTTVRVCGLHS